MASRSSTSSSSSSSSHESPTIRRRSNSRSLRRRDGLLQYARNETSQNGEDGIVEQLFHRIPAIHARRWCVDVGAWDGVHWSNTYSLLTNKNNNNTRKQDIQWQGVLIEANAEKFQQLQALHEPLHNVCLPATVSGQAKSPSSLEVLLEQTRQNQLQSVNEENHEHELDSSSMILPLDFDFLCIDIDGMDYWVLSNLLQNSPFNPRVICVEFNPTMPQDLIYIPPKGHDSRHGASLSALVELGEAHGYSLVETTLYNAFLVKKELYHGYLQDLVPDTSIEALQEVTMGTHLYQLYDGTLKLWGCQKMLWHRLPIQESKIQMLSQEDRIFPFAPPPAANGEDAPTAYSQFTKENTIINMQSWSSSPTNTSADRVTSARALLEQLQTNGFAYVSAPMDPILCQEALSATKEFLQIAPESVRRSCLVKDRAKRGYAPMNTENFASLLGVQGKNDLVLKYRMGPPMVDEANTNNSLLQPNVWPNIEEWNEAESFRATLESYYSQIVAMAQGVVAAICSSLLDEHPDLRESLEPLIQSFDQPKSNSNNNVNSSILTLLGYRTGARHKQSQSTKKRNNKNRVPLVAAHTDVGIITMLLFDHTGEKCASLQRWNKEIEDWISVPLPPIVPGQDPVFVVNVADCLSELSGGRLPSTLHRVVASPSAAKGDTRNGCGLFVGLNPQQRLTFPSSSDETAIAGDLHVLTFEDWRKRRIAKAQEALRQTSSSV